MRIADFALERYFARWEFAVEHVLCASDVQGLPDGRAARARRRRDASVWDGLELGYTESTGHPLLRREIASLYETIEPDEVLTFADAGAACCLAQRAGDAGDHVIVTWPGYQSLYEIARAAGADVTLHELREATAGRSTSIGCVGQTDAGDAPHRRQPPHNPTGMLAERPT